MILRDLCINSDFRMALLESVLTEGIIRDDSDSEPVLHCKCGQPRSVHTQAVIYGFVTDAALPCSRESLLSPCLSVLILVYHVCSNKCI